MLFSIILIGLITILCIQLSQKLLPTIMISVLALLYPIISTAIILNTPRQTDNTITWIPDIGLYFSFKLDAASYFFFLIISAISILVIFYSVFYMKNYNRHAYFYSSLTLFIIAMYGIVLSNNIIILYLFWELTSVASFLLIAFHFENEASYLGALKSFVITILGGAFMLIGFILLNHIAGTAQIDKILTSNVSDDPLFMISMILIMVGAFSKSAQFPFHIWLPDAMEAPTPVSALLHSATMVKAGIFLLIKFLPIYIGNTMLSYLLLIVGIFTMLIGSYVAISKHDMKALLAYSTISQLGMMVVFIGIIAHPHSDNFIRSSAYNGLILLILSHACYKATLFMGTGIVDLATGTRDMNHLKGLRHSLPVTFITMLISSLAMAGLPLLSGFLSKELLITSLFNIKDRAGFSTLLLFAIIGSIGTFIYCFVLIIRPFLGKSTVEIKPLHPLIDASSVILTLVTIVLFFIPNQVQALFIEPIVQEQTSLKLEHISAWHGFTPPLFITIFIFLVGFIVIKTGYYKYLFGLFDKVALNKAYNFFGKSKEYISKQSLSVLMTGTLNVYVIYLYVFIIILILPNLVKTMNVKWSIKYEITLFTLIIGIIMIISALSLLFVKSRMTAVVLVGLVGYGISILFMELKAPDLALTQLVIETITTVLFLACFYHLPNLKKEDTGIGYKILRHGIALLIAMIVFLVMVHSNQTNTFATISTYYNNSYKIAGAKNVVNAILGDFRAFDTMLEGVVIMIVGFGIYTILKKGAKHEGK
ncbi:hydrogen gas-evolving membrane-bound hydrogenase subunit E [Macrococcus sp. EM39E]|uniref:hydrogen gas-evolving membrane-bound hydrogenase subunit E n=1 Tax=Macrococcus animalis TaxID=3395467 RepID=UPI0039BE6F2F